MELLQQLWNGQVACAMKHDEREMWEEGNAHLDDSLATEGGAEKDPEGHEEVPAADAAQIEQRIGPRRKQENAPETTPADRAEINNLDVKP